MSSQKEIGVRELLRLLKSSPRRERPGGVDEILDVLTTKIILLFIYVYPLVIGVHVYRMITTGWRHQFILHSSVFFIALGLHLARRSLGYRTRGMIILSAGILSDVWGLYNWGLLGSGVLTLAIICVFSALLLGTRGGLIMLIATTAIICVVGYLVDARVIVFPFDAGAQAISPMVWILNTSGYFVLVALAVVCIGLVYNHLIDLIGSLDQRARELEQSITERGRLEEQLVQSQKMEAVGRLAGGVAHDFNNQLMVIMLSAETIARRFGPDEPGGREAGLILSAGEKSAGLIRQLLAFSRKQIVNPRNVMLNDAIKDFSKMLTRLLGEDIKISTSLEAWPGLIRIDPVQLHQILLNLSVNARDAMPRGGMFTIKTMRQPIERDYAYMHPDMEPGNYVMLTISDTGVGMDAKTQEHIFEPFFTTKGQDKGTGLGLSTVYGIVKQNNGQIFVYSEPGIGTTFKIYFPEVGEADSVSPAGVPDDESHQGRGESIMVVEDDEDVRASICSILRSGGYKVIEQSSAQAALEKISRLGGNIDLLLTDVIMSEMNGRELAKKIQSAFPAIKVIFISGYDDQLIVHHGILDPGIDFIQKPFSRSALLARIEKSLRSQDTE